MRWIPLIGLALMGCEVTVPPLGQAPEDIAVLMRQNAPRMILRLPDLARETTLLQSEERGGIAFWRSLDNVQIMTRQGVVIASRGLGDDLMALSAEGLIRNLGKGVGGSHTRTEHRLSGEGRDEASVFSCTLSAGPQEWVQVGQNRMTKARVLTEACQGPKGNRINRYWRAAGAAVQSDIDMGPKIGRMTLTRVVEGR